MDKIKADTFYEIDACRSCNKPLNNLIVSLGKTPLANSLLRKDQLNDTELTFPLDLYLCESCSLVQIKQTVSPNIFKNYVYFSSYSDTMLDSAQKISQKMIDKMNLGKDSLVVELASNDGYLLQYYVSKHVPVLGIDPAENIAVVAEKKGVPTIADFFSSDLALKLASNNQQADVLHANNVLAHVSNLIDFVKGIKIILKPEGIAVIEVPYVLDMIEKNEFDTIYHEHLCYFSLTALNNLFSSIGLKIIDVERLKIHGGSLRVFISHGDALTHQQDSAVKTLLEYEDDIGITENKYYKHFSELIELNKRKLLTLLNDLKTQGKKIAAYGASAKGSTLLNVFGINDEIIDFVVDRSSAKQGLYTPGSHLPILAPEELIKKMPAYVLLLTWNFKEEILKQQAEYCSKGGKFIVPIPSPAIV